MMKVLVSDFIQSKHTKNIAKSIWEEASQRNKADLKTFEDVEARELAGHDVIFPDAPRTLNNRVVPVKQFLTNIQTGSSQKMAGFITDDTSAGSNHGTDGFTEAIQAACKEKKIEYKGCVDGRETLTTPFYEAVKRELDLSGEEWEDMVKLMNRNPMVQQMIGRGHEEDVSKAKAFARETLV